MWPARGDDRAVVVGHDAPPDGVLACDTASPGPELAAACERACRPGAPFQVAAPSVAYVPRAALAAAAVVYVHADAGPFELELLRRRFRPGATRLCVTHGDEWTAVRAPRGGAFGDEIPNP